MKGNARNKVFKISPICPGIEVTKYQDEICRDYMEALQFVFDYEPLNFLIGYDVPNQFRPKRRTAVEKKKYERMAEYLARIFIDED